MTPADVLLAFVGYADTSPSLAPDVRRFALAIVQSHPELRTPEVARALGTRASAPPAAAPGVPAAWEP